MEQTINLWPLIGIAVGDAILNGSRLYSRVDHCGGDDP